MIDFIATAIPSGLILLLWYLLQQKEFTQFRIRVAAGNQPSPFSI